MGCSFLLQRPGPELTGSERPRPEPPQVVNHNVAETDTIAASVHGGSAGGLGE